MTNPDAIQPDPASGGSAPRITGWRRLQLIRDLAVSDETQEQIALRIGRSRTTVAQFAGRHRAEIEAIRKADGDALAALWIAQKASRVAEYQADAERLAQELERPVETPDDLDDDRPRGADSPALVRARALVLRSVAEELGQLTQKVDTTSVVQYHIVGIDPEALT